MDTLWQAVLASAAVGALVSQVVSLVGQSLERKARREELLLAQAVELSVERTKMMMAIAKDMGKSVGLWDNAVVAAKYYRWLKSLIQTGTLPPDAVAAHEGTLKKFTESSVSPPT